MSDDTLLPLDGRIRPSSVGTAITIVRELVAFHGIVTAECKGADGHPYILHWVDSDASSNRWLLFRTTPEALQGLAGRTLTLHHALLNAPDRRVYLVETGALHDPLEWQRVLECRPGHLPHDYLPEPDAMLPVLNDGDGRAV